MPDVNTNPINRYKIDIKTNEVEWYKESVLKMRSKKYLIDNKQIEYVSCTKKNSTEGFHDYVFSIIVLCTNFVLSSLEKYKKYIHPITDDPVHFFKFISSLVESCVVSFHSGWLHFLRNNSTCLFQIFLKLSLGHSWLFDSSDYFFNSSVINLVWSIWLLLVHGWMSLFFWIIQKFANVLRVLILPITSFFLCETLTKILIIA